LNHRKLFYLPIVFPIDIPFYFVLTVFYENGESKLLFSLFFSNCLKRGDTDKNAGLLDGLIFKNLNNLFPPPLFNFLSLLLLIDLYFYV